jgi:ribosomal protein L24
MAAYTQIKDVSHLPTMPGFLFVRCDNIVVLHEVCRELALICDAQYLPTEERHFLSDAVMRRDQFQVGTWVRIKATRNKLARYFNDLGIVASMQASPDGFTTVLLIPRIPQSDADYPPEYQTMSKKQRRMFKFTARVFDHSQAQCTDIDGIVTSTVDSATFRNGLLAQPFAPTQLVVEASPAFSEMIPFCHANYPPLRVQISTSIRKASVMTLWSPGDKVKVLHGSLRQLLGQIITLDLDKWSATIDLLSTSKQALESVSPEQNHQSFSIDDLCRYFQVGDSVEVCEGREKGRHGIIVLASEVDVTFAEDKTGDEVIGFHLQ